MKLMSLNIERDKHVDGVIAFLQKEKPDVVCLQELYSTDISAIEKALNAECFFVPMWKRGGSDNRYEGLGIFSTHDFISTDALYYVGTKGDVKIFDGTNEETRQKTQNFAVALANIKIKDVVYRVGATHFPWTPDGSASDFQRVAMGKLLSILKETGELVLCGDFNAPRGGEIFSTLAQTYKDNIPPHYTTSIDGSLHRAGKIPFMVDGLFSTPAYHVSEVSLTGGISDHCAVKATVQRK